MSITLALLLLVSTTSWKVEKHYCMGFLVDISFFSEAEGCGMNMDLPSDSDRISKENSCCDDVTIVVKGQDKLDVASFDFQLIDQVFICSYIYSYFSLFEQESTEIDTFRYYPPPAIVKDICLLDETFLI